MSCTAHFAPVLPSSLPVAVFAFIFLIFALGVNDSDHRQQQTHGRIHQGVGLNVDHVVLCWGYLIAAGARSCHLWDKVSGGNLYPLSYVKQMQILCWLSCCTSCQQGGLGMSLSLLLLVFLLYSWARHSVSCEVFIPLWNLNKPSQLYF